MNGGYDDYPTTSRLHWLRYRSFLPYLVPILSWSDVRIVGIGYYAMNPGTWDYTNLLAVSFICSLVVGLFIRSIDHIMRELHSHKHKGEFMD